MFQTTNQICCDFRPTSLNQRVLNGDFTQQTRSFHEIHAQIVTHHPNWKRWHLPISRNSLFQHIVEIMLITYLYLTYNFKIVKYIYDQLCILINQSFYPNHSLPSLRSWWRVATWLSFSVPIGEKKHLQRWSPANFASGMVWVCIVID